MRNLPFDQLESTASCVGRLVIAAQVPQQHGAVIEGIDMAGVNSYKDGVVDRLYKGLQGLVKGAKAAAKHSRETASNR